MKFKTIAILLSTLTTLVFLVQYFSDYKIASPAGQEMISYNFHIRPIFSDKCFKCHGPDANKRKEDLRLDTQDGAYARLKSNPDRYAIVPGDPDASEVYLRIHSADTSEVMPPVESNLVLTKQEKELIGRWIKQGAQYQPHWAFIPPKKEPLPAVKQKDWPQNELDFFILHQLETLGLTPNPQADKERLLKRVSFDLTGLPPSVELQEQFLQDNSEHAYEKMVDKLMNDPHYGEKMALHWLDVARYADSHGYQDDGPRTMWPWRDWVIHAFNENYSYQKFVTWQLAGDLVPEANKETLLASGFNRNHKITQEGGVIEEEYRIEYVTDRTNTFGKAFLAMTFECAKCHDHKYDPIPQKAYYGTFAFFNQVAEKGLYALIDTESPGDPPNMKISNEDVAAVLQFLNKKDSAEVVVMVMKDSSVFRPTHILNRGNYDAPGEIVEFDTPADILPFDSTRLPKNRLGLAEWLFDKKNPLTARVYVNRLWQEFFGRGIVKTSGDFGMQGELPSHPALLDWLAVDFIKNDWNIKYLVKKIVMSAAYRQSTAVQPKKLELDPENVYLARGPRLRLPAEMVRDHVLASSGLLNDEIGGPSVKPYQPAGLWEAATSGRGSLSKYRQDSGKDLYRRGMYVFIKRTVPPPTMLLFDASNRDQCEVKRTNTNTPLQALVMLNDPNVLEASRVYAEKLIQQKKNKEEIISQAFRSIICRQIRQEELFLLMKFHDTERQRLSADPSKADKLLSVGEYPKASVDRIETAAIMQVIHAIFNMEEAIVKS